MGKCASGACGPPSLVHLKLPSPLKGWDRGEKRSKFRLSLTLPVLNPTRVPKARVQLTDRGDPSRAWREAAVVNNMSSMIFINNTGNNIINKTEYTVWLDHGNEKFTEIAHNGECEIVTKVSIEKIWVGNNNSASAWVVESETGSSWLLPADAAATLMCVPAYVDMSTILQVEAEETISSVIKKDVAQRRTVSDESIVDARLGC